MAPSLFRHKSAGFQVMTHNKEEAVEMARNSYEWTQNTFSIAELRKKILVISYVLMGRSLIPYLTPHKHRFIDALESVHDPWAGNNKRIADLGDAMEEDTSEEQPLDQFGGMVLMRLNHVVSIAKEMPDTMDEDVGNRENHNSMISFTSPATTIGYAPVEFEFDATVTPRNFADTTYSLPLLLPLRIQAGNNLQPFDMKCWPVNTLPHTSSIQPGNLSGLAKVVIPSPPHVPASQQPLPLTLPSTIVAPPPPPLPPPVPSSTGSLVPTTPLIPVKGARVIPPPPLQRGREPGPAPAPPPASSLAKVLCAKTAATKMKRSTHIGKLYRTLKGEVEGDHLNKKSSQGKRSRIGGSSRGKQGMADALAEMAKGHVDITILRAVGGKGRPLNPERLHALKT